jgi:hypothetical protein
MLVSALDDLVTDALDCLPGSLYSGPALGGAGTPDSRGAALTLHSSQIFKLAADIDSAP